jgi:hypothetical protein
MKNTIIAPSVLADFGNLQRDIEMMQVKPTGSTLTSWTAFCSNISYGMPVWNPLINMPKNNRRAFDDC